MKVQRANRFRGEDVDVAHLDAQLEDLFKAAGLLAFGTPLNGTKLENHDAVWLVLQFGAANTNVTTSHQLGRMPVGLMNVEMPATVPGVVPVVGQVTFGTVLATKELVTLRCNAASKLAAVILF